MLKYIWGQLFSLQFSHRKFELLSCAIHHRKSNPGLQISTSYEDTNFFSFSATNYHILSSFLGYLHLIKAILIICSMELLPRSLNLTFKLWLNEYQRRYLYFSQVGVSPYFSLVVGATRRREGTSGRWKNTCFSGK